MQVFNNTVPFIQEVAATVSNNLNHAAPPGAQALLIGANISNSTNTTYLTTIIGSATGGLFGAILCGMGLCYFFNKFSSKPAGDGSYREVDDGEEFFSDIDEHNPTDRTAVASDLSTEVTYGTLTKDLDNLQPTLEQGADSAGSGEEWVKIESSDNPF